MATVGEGAIEEGIATSSSEELCNALYASCASQAANRVFNQQDLLALHIIPDDDLKQLLLCTQFLTKNGLFKVMTKDGRPCWKVIKKEDAARYKLFNVEEALVYSYIESSGREGIWTRTVRARTNLHPTSFNRCIKTLESKGFIKSIQSAKHPNRKTYILAHLQPSDDITGGPFYTDGKLDEEFVHQLALWSERYILGRSWWHHGVGKKRERSRLTEAQAEDLKAQEFQGKESGRQRSRKPLPMPPSYTGYPTIPEITKAVNESKLSGVVMKEAEMQQLMDILCWDGRIMKVMNGKGYKAVRLSGRDDESEVSNGLTESPCGRCPVFDLCEEGGPVNARSCTYFQEWLAI